MSAEADGTPDVPTRSIGLRTSQTVMVTILLAGSFLAMLNQQMLSPALPSIMIETGVTTASVQWLQSGYALIVAVLVPFSAFLLGHFSTRRLYLGALTLFACGSMLCFLAPTFPLLLSGRILQAMGTGVLMPMCMTLPMFIFPKARRGTALGLASLVIGLAPTVGPSLSGVLIDLTGWHSIFLITAVLAAMLLALALVKLDDLETFDRISFDVPSAILGSLGLIGLLYGLSSFSSSGVTVFLTVSVILGIASLGAFVRRQGFLERPLLEVSLLRTRKFRISSIVPALMQAANYGTMVMLPLYVQDVLGYGATVSGLVMMPGAVLGAVAGYASGRLFDRHGVRLLVIIGGGVLTLSGLGMGLLGVDSSILWVGVCYALLSLSLYLLITPLKTWGLNSLADEAIPHANPIQNAFSQIGGSLGTALVVSLSACLTATSPDTTAVMTGFPSVHVGFMISAALTALCYLIILISVRDR